MIDMPNLKYAMARDPIRYLVTPALLAISIGWIILAFCNSYIAVALTRDDRIIQWSQFFF